MNLFIVPTHHVQQFWHLAEPLLKRAIKVSYGEFTIDQLKQFVAQGQSDLLLILDDKRQCHCAMTVQWIDYPNDRVAYVTYLAGTTHIGKQKNMPCWNQLMIWVKNNGGTKLQGSTKLKSVARLWQMKWGMKPKYTLMELDLKS